MPRRTPRYRLTPDRQVEQHMGPDDTVLLDPTDRLREFIHRSGETVRAVQIPGRFMVGADVCTDGYLVLSETGLRAISTPTFQKDYEPA